MRDALNVQYDARYGNMGGICMHARPDREGRLACGEPSFTPTEHNHTCGELELSFTVRWARLGCIVLTHTTSPQMPQNPIVVSFRATVRGHRSWKSPCDREGTSKMGIWYGVASEFTRRPYSNHACVSIQSYQSVGNGATEAPNRLLLPPRCGASGVRLP